MRVVSLVPSLTETLIECGVNVVGRTRFCIHPADKVKDIAIVGGTKEVDWDKLAKTKPDLVVFDREENRKEMANECPYPWTATHVTSIDNVGTELKQLAARVKSLKLEKASLDWQILAHKSDKPFPGWHNIPGFLNTVNNPRGNYTKIEYIIWRKPWMAVSQTTFIASVLKKLGFASYLPTHESAYPALNDVTMSDEDTFFLFSSEPYPFNRQLTYLQEQGFNGAVVDGELYSWFGIRSFRYLSKQYQFDN